MRCVLALCVLLAGAAARADEAADRDAKQAFLDGKGAFEQGAYERAYQLFERSYLLSHRPELLFNMASALQRLERPRAAADKLRAYLRVLPDDPDRAVIEERIRALDEEQRILEEKRAAQAVAAPLPPVAPPARRSRRGLAIGLGVTAGLVALGVGLGVGLGIGLSAPPPDYTPSTVGAHPGTF